MSIEDSPALDEDRQRRASRRRSNSKCPGHYRHWFTVRGEVGNYQAKCVRCGAPNPRWKDTESE